MSVDQFSQYGPVAGAYALGASSAWGFVMKVLLPRELKVLALEIQHLKSKIDEMTPELEEYRMLKKSALERDLTERD